MVMVNSTSAPHGFALASVEVRRLLGARGGRAAHAKGTAYKWTRETAIEAGRRGGKSGAARRRYAAYVAEQLAAGVIVDPVVKLGRMTSIEEDVALPFESAA